MKNHTVDDRNRILVFTSTISTNAEVERLRNVLDSHPCIYQWSIDMEDYERVIRVGTMAMKPNQVIKILANKGICVREMNH